MMRKSLDFLFINSNIWRDHFLRFTQLRWVNLNGLLVDCLVDYELLTFITISLCYFCCFFSCFLFCFITINNDGDYYNYNWLFFLRWWLCWLSLMIVYKTINKFSNSIWGLNQSIDYYYVSQLRLLLVGLDLGQCWQSVDIWFDDD